MNQSLSYLMLLAVGVMIVGPLMLHAQSNITSNIMSVHDFFELQEKRVAQQVAITHVQHEFDTTTLEGEIHIHIVNTGLEGISFNYVLMDGVPIPHDTSGKDCWDTSNPVVEITGFCLYSAASGHPSGPTLPLTLDPENNPDLAIDNNIRIAIPYKKTTLTDPDPEVIQLVTDAFKLFEVSLP